MLSKYTVVKEPNLRVLGYDKNFLKRKPKKALLSYLSSPIYRNLQGFKTKRFSNDGLALAWVQALNKLGYTVDIINWDDTDFVPAHEYDLFVGHAAVNFEKLHRALKPQTPTIYFSTGSYWKYHNQQEEKRLAEFKQRHGTSLPKDRYIETSEEYANKVANGIICLGNEAVKKTYAKFPAVYSLDIGCFADNHLARQPKNIETGRYHFIFHAGGGNIHKGLDLVLDAFEQLPPPYKLTINAPMDREFQQAYASTLKSSRYTVLGSLELRSQEFYRALDSCDYVVLPSCSEGSPGSVVECMMQGLIPIVSKESHIDVEGFGSTLPSVSIDSIAQAIVDISQRPDGELQRMSALARQTALSRHAPARFEQKLTQAVEQILNRIHS